MANYSVDKVTKTMTANNLWNRMNHDKPEVEIALGMIERNVRESYMKIYNEKDVHPLSDGQGGAVYAVNNGKGGFALTDHVQVVRRVSKEKAKRKKQQKASRKANRK